ncbi:MAG: (deoxy)nucleoside triphosphate pyrophosphohydrolase [Bacteroidales bacterium]|nr:(deoxy)nucleoside triphosphate pyrophosphohydrolase [Bacteroidales bacterium]
MKKIIVTCAIIRKDNKIFIAQRPQNKNYGGYWEFPGGKLEPNETLEDCIKRELYEELDIEVNITKTYKHIIEKYPEFEIELCPFEVDIIKNKITLKEHADMGFYTIEELKNIKLTEADKKIIEIIK